MKVTIEITRYFEVDEQRILAEPTFAPPPADASEDEKRDWLRESFYGRPNMVERPCKQKTPHEAHDYCPGPRSIHVFARCPGISSGAIERKVWKAEHELLMAVHRGIGGRGRVI